METAVLDLSRRADADHHRWQPTLNTLGFGGNPECARFLLSMARGVVACSTKVSSALSCRTTSILCAVSEDDDVETTSSVTKLIFWFGTKENLDDLSVPPVAAVPAAVVLGLVPSSGDRWISPE